ncbi:Hsp20/alpha crystallin family protein [Amphibacillus jilinensis]|uniref:Hsp20/alpha crystallin family protein n=1 Tax=Amphibacillus jilinensis TaxID=1216008 RepID=UPI00031271D6|nr:Hsp20/alpha crystallin family protein [Amphibacillus jilinensis]
MSEQNFDVWEVARDWVKKMDNLFNSYHQDSMLASIDQFFQNSHIPTHVNQTDEEWQVNFKLPGVTKDRVKLSIEQTHLAIRITEDEKKEVKDDQEGVYHFNHFQRERERFIHMPNNVIPSTLTASFNDGLLTVKARKKNEKKRDLLID